MSASFAENAAGVDYALSGLAGDDEVIRGEVPVVAPHRPFLVSHVDRPEQGRVRKIYGAREERKNLELVPAAMQEPLQPAVPAAVVIGAEHGGRLPAAEAR